MYLLLISYLSITYLLPLNLWSERDLEKGTEQRPMNGACLWWRPSITSPAAPIPKPIHLQPSDCLPASKSLWISTLSRSWPYWCPQMFFSP